MILTHKEAEEIVEIVWKHFDQSRNGYLDHDEAKEMFEFLWSMNNKELSRDMLKNLMDAIDANNDNRISREEIIGYLMSKV